MKRSSSNNNFIEQLVLFFGLAYLISWILWLPLYGPAFGLPQLPAFPFQHAIGGLGPLVASFLTTWIYDKKAGVRLLLTKCLQIRPLFYLAIALLGPFILVGIAAFISALIHKTPLDLTGILSVREFPQFNLAVFFGYNLLFFGFGEEVGWRGFALPRLQNKFNALTASLMLTVLWALWHWPLFFYRPGYTAMDAAGVAGWVFSLLTGSILLTWLFNSSRASLLICAVFHATIDIAFTADIGDKNTINYLGGFITVWGIVTILFFKSKNLSRHERIQSLNVTN